MLFFHAPTDVDVAISVCFFPLLPKMQMLSYSFVWASPAFQMLMLKGLFFRFTSFFLPQYAAIGFLPPKCKMWMLQIIVCLTPSSLSKLLLSRCRMWMLQWLFVWPLPPSLDFYLPKMQDVARIVCWFVCLTKMQETDFAIIVCLTSTLVY